MKALVYVLLLLPCMLFAQVESISEVTVGGGSDYTNQPVSFQSDFSHSQTLYYPEQLKFRGTINEIRFFTIFSNPSQTNSGNWVVKIGQTDKEEFLAGDNFIQSSELTEVFNGGITFSGYNVILTLTTPFYYDGTQNLVLDVEETFPGHSTSALLGFQGAENFGNPPTRSMMSFTTVFNDGTSSTSTVRENSYAKTQFLGNLERCIWVTVSNINNITTTTADVTLINDPNVTTYRYVITESGEEIPSTYNTTTSNQFSLTNLLPAQRYMVNVKSDCDEIYSDYRSYSFITRPVQLTLPHTIDFDGSFNRDYIRSNDFQINVATEAANNSTNGLLMAGPSYVPTTAWSDFGNPFVTNASFVTRVTMEVDLTANAINPILTFDIKQTVDSYVRVKINGIAQDFIYGTTSGNTDFRTISIDLSAYFGSLITLDLENASKNQFRKTYIDNISLKENDCDLVDNITTQATTTSILTNWTSSASQWEVVYATHAQSPPNTFITANSTNSAVENLNVATPYDVYIRSLCASSNSPWAKTIVSTEPNPITQSPFTQYFNSGSLVNGFFAPQHNKSTDITVPNASRVVLHQKYTSSQWIGGTTTTESQAWNDNKDFVTGLKFKIDATNLATLNLELRYKLTHHYQSNPTNSWFRVLINGVQYGQSYNPVTKNTDPITTLNIDLSTYSGTMIDIVLQQSGRSYDYSTGAVSGDGTIIYDLNLIGTTLGVQEATMANPIKLYPNPAHSELNVQSTQPMTVLTITDISGKQISKQEFKINNPLNYKLDVSGLSQGIYFIEAQSDSAKQTLKFIKE